MRHAEKTHFEDMETENAPPYEPMIEHDPPLTVTGLAQATQAG